MIINATELRQVNFTMVPAGKGLPCPVQDVRRSGRGHRAAIVNVPAPLPKEYVMPQQIDDDIRGKCW